MLHPNHSGQGCWNVFIAKVNGDFQNSSYTTSLTQLIIPSSFKHFLHRASRIPFSLVFFSISLIMLPMLPLLVTTHCPDILMLEGPRAQSLNLFSFLPVLSPPSDLIWPWLKIPFIHWWLLHLYLQVGTPPALSILTSLIVYWHFHLDMY